MLGKGCRDTEEFGEVVFETCTIYSRHIAACIVNSEGTARGLQKSTIQTWRIQYYNHSTITEGVRGGSKVHGKQ